MTCPVTRALLYTPVVVLLAGCAEQRTIAPCLDLAEVSHYGTMDDTKSDGTAPGGLGIIRGVVTAPRTVMSTCSIVLLTG